MFTVARAVFFHVEFFTSGLTAQHVVVRTALCAYEKHRFRFFLAFSHFKFSKCSNREVSPAMVHRNNIFMSYFTQMMEFVKPPRQDETSLFQKSRKKPTFEAPNTSKVSFEHENRPSFRSILRNGLSDEDCFSSNVPAYPHPEPH